MLTRMIKGFIFCLMLMPQSVRDYPTKPVRLIEPFGAGGGPDLIARALGQSFLSLGPARHSRESPGSGKYGGPGPRREIARRRLHIAREHQRSSVQRRVLEEPAV